MTADALSARTTLDTQFDVRRTLREDQSVPDDELKARLIKKFQKNLKLNADGSTRRGLWRLGINVSPSGKGRELRIWGYYPFGNLLAAAMIIIAALIWYSFSGMTGVGMLQWLEGLDENQFQQKINFMHVLQPQAAIDAYFEKGRMLLFVVKWLIPGSLVASSLFLLYGPRFLANRAIDALMREL